MPPTLPPLTAADNLTIVPPEPDIVVCPWHSWIPTPDTWNHAPTFLLPPAKPAPPVPIPDGVHLIPTDVLPPPMLDFVASTPTSIRPPAMLGPIQVVDVEEAPPPSWEPTSCATEPKPAPAPPALPLADFPLRRCAQIAATLALQPQATPNILHTHHLDAPTWKALQTHWTFTINTALDNGDATLLRAYDAAFVAALEALRGPITTDDQQRIVAAHRRTHRAETFTALALPLRAAPAIERVLLQRRCMV